MQHHSCCHVQTVTQKTLCFALFCIALIAVGYLALFADAQLSFFKRWRRKRRRKKKKRPENKKTYVSK